MERLVLEGAEKTIVKYRPVVLVESLLGAGTVDFIKEYFKKLGYKEPEYYGDRNWLFVPDSYKEKKM